MKMDLTKEVWWLRHAFEQYEKSVAWREFFGMPDNGEFGLDYHITMAQEVKRGREHISKSLAKEQRRLDRGGKPRHYSIMNQGR